MRKTRSYWIYLFLFIPLYHFTKSPLLASDGEGWIQRATNPSPTEFHYGATGHFLQMPLAHHLHLILNTIRLDFSVRQIFLAICFWSAFGSLFFFYFFLQHWFRFHEKGKEVNWIPLAGTFLYGTSFAPWVYWNGELFSLSLFSLFASFFFLSKRRLLIAGFSWAISVLAHSEFSLIAPAFAFFLFIENKRRPGKWLSPFLKECVYFFSFAGGFTLFLLLAGGFLLQKWNNAYSLVQWFNADLESRVFWLQSGLQPVKALKGLITSVTVAGHYFGETLKGWRPKGISEVIFWIWSLGQVALVLALAALALFRWKTLIFVLFWIIPLQVLLNWRFLPAVEEYHSASQPAFVLLILSGLLVVWEKLGRRAWIVACFSIQFFLLNLILGVLPLRNFGDSVLNATSWFSKNSSAVVLVCDAQTFLENSRIETFRIKNIARNGNPKLEEIRSAIYSWIENQFSAGKSVYTLGKKCDADYWSIERVSAKLASLPEEITQMSFSFLEQKYLFKETPLTSLPLNAVVATNPITWKKEALYELSPSATR